MVPGIKARLISSFQNRIETGILAYIEMRMNSELHLDLGRGVLDRSKLHHSNFIFYCTRPAIKSIRS